MRHSILPLFLAGILATAPAWADWSLDPARSHLNFVSIKANDVAEINTFGKIQGVVDSDGQAVVTLMLDSVETLIPIRNERIRQFLFETTNYQEAVLKARIDPQIIAGMAVGDIAQITAEGSLSLHGQVQPMTLAMQAAKVDDKTVMVVSIKPLIVDAAKFGMGDGVEKLRELAGLASISKAVPVNVVMTFIDVSAQ
jgi:polyisoprenoid-binding protein YceI